MNTKSAPATLLLGTVGLVLLAALGWVALVGPAFGAIGEADQARADAQDRNSAMALQLTKLRRQAAEVPRVQRLAGRLDRVFPPTADQPGFFADVTEAAADAGIPESDITVFSPSVPVVLGAEEAATNAEGEATEPAPPAVTDLAVQTITINVEGTYEQFTEVLANLERMNRAMLTTSVTMDGGDGGDDDIATLTITGNTFVSPPLGDPPDQGGAAPSGP